MAGMQQTQEHFATRPWMADVPKMQGAFFGYPEMAGT
jgi:hypothetical protein